ncbi:MAG: hypothetical protein AABO58_17120 [Acidobacteriota bacterium]
MADPDAYEMITPPDEMLAGIDLERLRIVGRLILAKRLGKIETLLPATCRCVTLHVPTLVRAFAAACPPVTLGRQENARQFRDFILAYEGPPLAPGYLADLAQLEYLAAAASFTARDGPSARPTTHLDPSWTACEVRVSPELHLFETEYDLPAAFVDSPPAALARGRPRLVAIVPVAPQARVFQLEEDITGLLLDLQTWTAVEPEGARQIVESLGGHGLVELRRCDSAS